MVAKPKLTQEEWKHARDVWEGSPRKGFPWLIDELDLPVSAEAIRLRSKSEGWKKKDNPSLEKKKNKLGKKKKKVVSDKKNIVNASVIEKPGDGGERGNAGRPTEYREEYAELAYKLCLLGAIDDELASFFEVSEQSINNWKKDHPEFFESIREGKIIADAEVAESTFKSATGKHFVTEDKVVGFEVQEIKRQVPPDVAAQRMWLFNRRPKEWRNKIELKEEIDLNIFPSQEVLDEVYANALEKAAQRNDRLAGRRERLVGIVIDQDDITDV